MNQSSNKMTAAKRRTRPAKKTKPPPNKAGGTHKQRFEQLLGDAVLGSPKKR